MSASRRAKTASRLAVLNVVLMTTAFTVPAFGQIETVVVTAERKAEDIQTVPIAVTALTAQDLKAKQVNTFRDLQFHVPSVTYTKHNFSGSEFEIRGITTQYGLGAAIAINEDEIYNEQPSITTGEYFDVDRVEVSRGPQSTLYGRAATGGAVDVITTKADLNNFAARFSMDYGTFNTMKPDAMVNIPIIDGELAIRFAAHAVFHDGYENNIYPGPQVFPGGAVDKRVNSQGTAGGRVSVRWEPDSDTTVDFIGEVGYEADTRVAGDKQLCHRDPSGVIGCLPDKLGFDAPNELSQFSTVLGSKQGIGAALTPALGFAAAQTYGNTLGLFQLAGNGGPGDPAGPAGAAFLGVSLIPNQYSAGVPLPSPPFPPGLFPMHPQVVNGIGSNANGLVTHDLLTSNTPYNPKTVGNGQEFIVNWQQKIVSWLSSSVDLGYITGRSAQYQNYNNVTPENISGLITQAVTAFDLSIPAHGVYDNAYFNIPGTLPLSSITYGGKFGSYGGVIDYTHGGVLTKTSDVLRYDEDNFSATEWTGEVRFQTAFEGPLNFSAGAFYMANRNRNQYWVAGDTLDWEAIVLGAVTGQGLGNLPLVLADTAYDGEYRKGDVLSRSAFVEATYEILPNTLSAIVGARFNDDRASYWGTPVTCTPPPPNLVGPCGSGGLLDTNGAALVGSTTVGFPQVPFPFSLPAGTPGSGKNVKTNDLWTGRATLNYTPKIDWTDQTLIYFTASRGELAGGFNKTQNSTALTVPVNFAPATVDALEIGTKNTLLDGTLQLNLDAWYYNYENYQVGIISNRAALTFNVPAHLDGFETEALWQPTDKFAVNFTLSLTDSAVGKTYAVDGRNPTGGVPGNILVKDLTNGSFCVVQPLPGGPRTAGQTPGDSNPLYHINNFYLPNGGNAAIDAPFGVPLVNYGTCGTPEATLEAAGFQYTLATNPTTGALIPGNHDGSGVAANLHGNNLPQVPFGQVGVGAQYTFSLGSGFTFVPRVDYYWQAHTETRVWNDANIDRVGAWDVMNVNLQVNAPDGAWYARAFATNLFDKKNVTGAYFTDPTSSNFTNVFVEDPRVIGIGFGTNW